MKVSWLGHASFKVELDGMVIYFDPYKLEGEAEEADLVLITHAHHDHCDEASLRKITSEKTPVIAPKAAAAKLSGNVSVAEEGERIELREVAIEVVPAYNTAKPYHPKGSGVGYVVRSGEESIYHAGDTDFILEMESIRNVKVALLPVGGTYTMNADEAVEAVKTIKPKYAIPMHYGSAVNPREAARKFMEKVASETDAEPIILSKGEETEL
jgi:L-ascorbate metabolism protein UlaG (beta-lactamase superfamily)